MPKLSAEQLTTAHNERAKCIADADVIVKRCKADGGRDLTGEESAEFDKLHNRAADLYGQIQSHRESEDRERRHAEAVGSLEESRGRRVGSRPSAPSVADPQSLTFRGQPMRLPSHSAILFRASAEYAEAFRAYLNGGQFDAALQTDIADQGGYLAPPQFVAELVKELDNSFWFRQLARVLPPTTAPKVTMPRRSARMSAFVWGSELATPTADTAYRLGTYSLTPHYQSGEVEVSNDLISAGSLNVESIVRQEILFNATDLEENAFFTGDGDKKPLGVFTASADGIASSRDTTANPNQTDSWVNVKFSLAEPYLRSPALRWVMHRNAVKLLAKLKSGTGEPLWLVSTRVGEPDTLLGKPVVMSEYAPSGTGGSYTTGDYVAILGDFAHYDIQDSLDFGISRMTDSHYARRNMTGFIVRRKVDGCPRIGSAFARLKAS